MQLTSVKLSGFKSFADPTVIPVPSHMNGIVGPNGCGKSNVFDAIKWVIGETSAKQLRGQSMSDVIFNGTTTRKPVGKAMVELLFDNTSGRIGGEYASFNELSVRRELTRDGQSNYFLNGASCRRRDIVDIFMGTGLGPRSYAIIEQGMISNLVEAKPDDMRGYIEEVAGISMYKSRRRETESRMARTQENLDRLNDLMQEIEKQLKHLDRQAQSAEKYKALKQEERNLQSQIKALHWQSLQKQLEKHDTLIDEQTLWREQLLADQRQVETEIEKIKVSQAELTIVQNDVQKSFYSLGADIARVEQRIKSAEEQNARWRREFQEVSQLIEEIEHHSGDYQEQISELEAELSNLQPKQQQLGSAVLLAKENLVRAEKQMQQADQQFETHRKTLNQTTQQQEVARTKLQHYQQQFGQLTERCQRFSQQLADAPLETVQAELEPLTQEALRLQTTVDHAQNALNQLATQIQTQRQEQNTVNQAIQDARKMLSKAEAKCASLEALQKAALGAQDMQHWLKAQALEEALPLGKLLRVEAGWELAVEAVLGDYLEALCVEQSAAFLEACHDLEKGQVTLLSKEDYSVVANPQSLAAKVACEWSLPNGLYSVLVADDLAQALELQKNLSKGQSIITQEGVWLGTNFVRVAKKALDQGSVLLREQEIVQLNKQIEIDQLALAELEERLQQLETSRQRLEGERETAHKDYQRQSQAFTEVKTRLSAKQSQYDALVSQHQRIVRDQKETEQQVANLQAQIAALEVEVNQQGMQLAELQKEQAQITLHRQTSQEQLASARELTHQEQQRQDELGIRLASNESQLAVLKQTMNRDERQMAQLQERHQALEEKLADVDLPLQLLQEELQVSLSRRSEVETQLRQVESTLQEYLYRFNQLDQQRQTALQKQNIAQTELERLRMDRQAVSIRQLTIIEQLQEADIQLEQVIETMPSEANLSQWEKEAEQVGAKIARLGPINLAAIDEYKTLAERKNYLDQQHADLVEALSILTDAIAKIDRETRTKFKETFLRVNAGFEYLFPRVFGGGRAYLELETDDLLTTGILVKAQPPGKRNSTIHMLSGGEKALTALALVFSLFQLNPAPFCILDEVDAPLDDVNVGRFCQLVKEMSAKVQFLVISHNKVTIEKCDHLMGVTMQEPGVSRLVAVDMEQAIAMVEA